jgi:dynein heavy chain
VLPAERCAQHADTAVTLLVCRLIFTLREYPTTEDFVYLRRFTRWPADCNPYALEVVQFADINQANYYTMSVRGITHYINGVNAEFASTCRTH